MIRSTLSSATNTDMTDAVWGQATLPVNRGGLGIRQTSELSLVAYLASVHSVIDLVSMIIPADFGGDLDELRLEPGHQWCHLTDQPTPSSPTAQKHWDTLVVDKHYDAMFDMASPRDQARLRAVTTKESSAWFSALPVPHLGTLLDDDALRIAVAFRLGAAVCIPHECAKCSTPEEPAWVDVYGHHGLSYLYSARPTTSSHSMQRRYHATTLSPQAFLPW